MEVRMGFYQQERRRSRYKKEVLNAVRRQWRSGINVHAVGVQLVFYWSVAVARDSRVVLVLYFHPALICVLFRAIYTYYLS
jgi:hypothetical protein